MKRVELNEKVFTKTDGFPAGIYNSELTRSKPRYLLVRTVKYPREGLGS